MRLQKDIHWKEQTSGRHAAPEKLGLPMDTQASDLHQPALLKSVLLKKLDMLPYKAEDDSTTMHISPMAL